MTDFNPGEGWREVHVEEATYGKRTVREFDEEGMTDHVWVREEPVPALPTEPYTVIRVMGWKHRRKDVGVIFVNMSPAWVCGPNAYMPIDFAESITGFEVLSEPRAVTAKAVLLRAWGEIEGNDALGGGVWDAFGDTASEFGVES